MSKSAPELTEAEWVIIKAVWSCEPCAAPTIQELLAPTQGWAYSTVRTLMDRMVTKGFLRSEKIRNLTLYRSVVTREDAQRGDLLHTLKHAFDGALTPMMQCLLESQKLSPGDIEELEALIKAKKQKR
ncbi:MAG TPA: BlaI/MecI/CopY family transcriptional regulator [Candidatus Limnocylindria bacterium]|jgi:BlaI family penicillinase repressor|nr:BlaI/MecI/CopY family transcriptional regulator [Candidatus Limnocylindria bacterium]